VTSRRESYDAAIDAAAAHARLWLERMPKRRVPPYATAADVRAALGDGLLPDGPTEPAAVVNLLAEAAEPGLTATPAGRFFGFVIGGTHPAALAADWLVSAWDQNQGLRMISPAAAAIEDLASEWLLDLLGLPAGSAVGFVTGATMANFTCLAAARDNVLARAGWNADDGLAAAPRVRVVVGAERHDTVDLALRYLGIGKPEVLPADQQGRIRVDALAAAVGADRGRPTIVCLQAGNIHSGASDAFTEAIRHAHDVGAWVHVDGAFGLWAAASPDKRWLISGVGDADSWATDAHKTLNVPYDCGVAIVRDAAAMRAAMGMHGDYLITDNTQLEPYERVPELSRRARAIPVWAMLRSLGRSGVAALVDGLCERARALAEGVRRIPGVDVLNDVVFTQVCLAMGSDERTREVGRRLMDDGTVWVTGSRWRDRDVLRISVSNWSTDDEDVERCLDALARAAR
jgi:glutamate/tyrosine decarboxylase-like PLP-dependent enzyme